MREVSKSEFRDMFFRYGSEAEGWGEAYWNRFFAEEKTPPMAYKVEPPASPLHTRMMIVSDYGSREHRLFFLTEESEASFFGT
jgi:hypothetical protein